VKLKQEKKDYLFKMSTIKNLESIDALAVKAGIFQQ